MKLYSIDAGTLTLDGGAMFGVVPKVVWQKKYPAEENNLCNWAMRCLLIVQDTRTILIDTGIGIIDKDLDIIFQPFERLDSSMRIQAGGTGLGLYLVKKIATELLQGSISVQSQQDIGSCFILRIPKLLVVEDSNSNH